MLAKLQIFFWDALEALLKGLTYIAPNHTLLMRHILIAHYWAKDKSVILWRSR